VRLAALLHDAGKPDTFSLKDGVGHFYGHTDASLVLAEQTLLALKCDNITKNEVLTLIKYHDPVIEPTEKAVKRALSKLGKPMLLKLLDLKSADNLAQAPSCYKRLDQYEIIRKLISEIEKRNECFTLKDLKINGNTLITLGIPKGKEIGRILDDLLTLVIDGTLKNEKEALTEMALKLKG
jgi:tRNA nucleotidyltransferase (CCA-adding enzyme)